MAEHRQRFAHVDGTSGSAVVGRRLGVTCRITAANARCDLGELLHGSRKR